MATKQPPSLTYDSDDSDSEDERDAKQRRRLAAVRVALRMKRRAEPEVRQASGPRGPKRRPLSLFDWDDHLQRLSPREFKLRYRLDLDSFEYLHGLLEDKIATKDLQQAKRSRSKQGEVTSRTRLAITLRYLAGGMVLDLSLIYHVSQVRKRKDRARSLSLVTRDPQPLP